MCVCAGGKEGKSWGWLAAAADTNAVLCRRGRWDATFTHTVASERTTRENGGGSREEEGRQGEEARLRTLFPLAAFVRRRFLSFPCSLSRLFDCPPPVAVSPSAAKHCGECESRDEQERKTNTATQRKRGGEEEREEKRGGKGRAKAVAASKQRSHQPTPPRPLHHDTTRQPSHQPRRIVALQSRKHTAACAALHCAALHSARRRRIAAAAVDWW